ncbi:hypothetical protein DFQ26_008238 [Actinomortierella ambigua]|nr:hypothetical protein DFQ26_008238 [Actinomortierella ambigua]
MVGLMTYLGHIYGNTNQTLENEVINKDQVSFWHIASPDVSSAFWQLVDPGSKGGYLEICPPVVLTMATPSYSANGSECLTFPQSTTPDCEASDNELDDGTTLHKQPQKQQPPGVGSPEGKNKPKTGRKGKKKGKHIKGEDFNDGTLDPRRPFKMLKNGIIFFFFFAFWLLRVFVIPSMILAAAVLVLLSYLLSPQRKLLVDLQWRFPFIVLPGDYQSKRQLMMEQLLAQEAHELGLDGSASSVAPLPGTVETYKRSGHVTDIEQMDVNPAGLILSSSMDKKILLWQGGDGGGSPLSAAVDESDQSGKRLPLARLLSATTTVAASTTTIASGLAATPYMFPRRMGSTGESTKRIVRCLKLDPLGRFAAAGYTDGGVHLWAIDTVAAEPPTPIGSQKQHRSYGWVPELKASLELRRQHPQMDPPLSTTQDLPGSVHRDRVMALQFWNDVEDVDDDEDEDDEPQLRGNTPPLSAAAPSPPSAPSTALPSLIVGYRDGQVCEWCPRSGRLRTSFQTKHRGGIAELALVRLTPKTRLGIGLCQPKTYLVTAGKDGSLQCWVRFAPPPSSPSSTAAVTARGTSTFAVHHGQLPQQPQQPQQNHTGEAQDAWQWSRIWTVAGDGSGSPIVVLSVDKQVPMVATGTANGAIKVWDLEQGNLIWTLSRGVVSSSLNVAAATSAGVAGTSSGHHPLHRPSASLPHSRKQSLGSTFENHQPSHQAAVTRIFFKPLELEDGITGEPAPRVWLIISSSMDEAVMVWMVEWEGLLSMASASGSVSALPSSPVHPHEMSPPQASGAGVGSSLTLSPPPPPPLPSPLSPPSSSSSSPSLQTPPPFLRTSQRSNSQINLHHHLGLLSTSLPAPRLVGYMKQRGGKSIAVRHTSIFGVRRKENAGSGSGNGNGNGANGSTLLSARKQSYASVLDAAGLSQPGSNGPIPSSSSSLAGGLFRNRNKGSDPGSATSQQGMATTPAGNSSSGNNNKRGWEVWEADLYQCIFKDPGVWGLDLAVRTIDLQPATPPPVSAVHAGANGSSISNNNNNNNNGGAGFVAGASALTPSSSSSNLTGLSTMTLAANDNGAGVGGLSMPMVTTNGSSAPVLVSYDPTGAISPTPTARLRRRPGSNTSANMIGSNINNNNNSIGNSVPGMPTQGYVYSMADTATPMALPRHQQTLTVPDPWMDEPAMMMMEEPEPDLLPFVETRHIFAVDYMPLATTTTTTTTNTSTAPFSCGDHFPTPPPLHASSPSSSSSPSSPSKPLPPPPPPLRRWPSEQNVHLAQQQQQQQQQQQHAQTSEMGGIVVGFGNWIKVVRLQDEEDDEDYDSEDPYGYPY